MLNISYSISHFCFFFIPVLTNKVKSISATKIPGKNKNQQEKQFLYICQNNQEHLKSKTCKKGFMFFIINAEVGKNAIS